MSDSSPTLSLPYLLPSQAQKHVTHNEALQLLDVAVQTVVTDRDRTEPPGSPVAGDCHIVAAGATGDWAGQSGSIAQFNGSDWGFFAVKQGWRAQVLAEDKAVVFDGSDWAAQISVPDTLDNLDGVGVGTTSDPANRLAVASEATLLSHDGAGHQLKINKSGAGDTASLLFQTGWSGRAEMGTAGADDFAIKVSADGSAWATGMSFDAATGQASLPQGVQIDGALTGTAVQQESDDTTSGRLLSVGAFGLGASALESTDLDGCDVTGIYRADASTLNAPSGSSNWIVLHMKRTSGIFVQLAISRANSSRGRMAVRASSSGGWSDWSRIYSHQDILGNVNQSGGVPTGALIETGSNANGDYTRWADGTQICTNGNAAITIEPAGFVGTITKIDADKLWIGRWF